MTSAEKLVVLKSNLNMATSANDDFLGLLIQQAQALMETEGITVEDDIQCSMANVDYAAYLFRKRSASPGETAMPRFLRYELNNILLSQKAKVQDGGDV